jgi:hypothetical protein
MITDHGTLNQTAASRSLFAEDCGFPQFVRKIGCQDAMDGTRDWIFGNTVFHTVLYRGIVQHFLAVYTEPCAIFGWIRRIPDARQ